jgi:hypothetical protein
MLGMGLLLGDGRPVFRVELNVNQDQWRIVDDAPQLLVSYPIILHISVAPGVTIASTASTRAGISFFGLPNYSDVYLTNRGFINGANSASPKLTTGKGVDGNWNGGKLFINNASGWITAGTCSDGIGYAVAMAGSPASTLQWISGASRITGTVYP